MAGLRGRALIAYLLVCVVWGSTYLFIRIGVADLPPFLFAGARFLIAGLLLGGVMLATGDKLPSTRRDWITLSITGVLFLMGANAIVVWAEQTVPSGPASVYVAAVLLWTAFIDSMVPGGKTRFTWQLGLGLLLGFAGICLLSGVRPGELLRDDLAGPIGLIFASASWASGSVLWKRRPTSTSPYVSAAVQMVVGGGLIVLLGLALGEGPRWQFTSRSMGALVYLILVGSIVGYTAFGYALKYASATVVGTYAYVNPVVAVILGWLVLDEQVTGRMLASMAMILGAVLWIQLSAGRTKTVASNTGEHTVTITGETRAETRRKVAGA
ncbi:MAG TPA: EamA family transporter [Gemmatimonadales bacterium]|jgi:drug/metabolite transporter (DMT)-like permease